VNALSSGGLHQAGKDTMGFQSTIRSRSEAYFAEDHQMPERLFRKIVGGRYAGTPQESEEKFLLGTVEKGTPLNNPVRKRRRGMRMADGGDIGAGCAQHFL